MKKTILASTILTALAAPALANTAVDTDIEQIKIIGSKTEARNVAGSSAVIDEEQMRIEVPSDINQLMKTIPGVYVREEDGQGLRPNIGIRAATAGRVSKVTLLEDGVLMAPAPYSNPAAYYFPTTFRMSSVEVLKGAPLLRYGPQTTGGVLNLVSTPIPENFGGQVLTEFGENSSRDIHAHVGGTEGQWGFLLETVQRSSNGFKEIDRSGRDAGFDIEDYVAKLQWTGERQSLLAKVQYSEETSNETYAGLTDEDFAENPNRRYGISEIDQMNNHHDSVSLNYSLELTDSVDLNVLGYKNHFKRNWFKAGVANSLIAAANAGDEDAQAVLDGERDYQDITWTNGNRSYDSYGVEINTGIELASHFIEVGVRDHTDEMDRYQLKEVYDQINGSLVFDSFILPTGGDNRLERADAISFWITDQWQATDDLMVNLALRHEDVESSRRQFATPDRSELDSTRSNDSDEWLPGVSFTYDVNDNWQVLAGAHKGFSPLGGGAKDFQEPETSNNYEAGVRFNQGSFFAEAIGFYSDFSDTTQQCSIANPCDNGSESGSYVLGESTVAGLELQASNTFELGQFLMPVDLAYTYTKGEISQDNAVTGLMDGDELNDIPQNTFSVRVALDNNKGWVNYVVGKYIDEMCVSVGCNRDNSRFNKTESLFVTDFVSRYEVDNNMAVYFKVENLFDQQKIVARSPHGARPNKPQTASLGVEYTF
ncbi:MULTISPECIES: TonB-dependent receptor [Idiomarina]|jgi:Fe(3+) dicitrate transport protein|uniref:TonB-dependent receptor family protein n=1 Tax=Idiomarina TaxID=135575 RepID=UPI000C5940CF|nr:MULTISPECIES: TonB-dependent receptor [Idiomarina]MAO68786.1 TonB-dependent receptor [Idiomarina sp.]MBF79270.1 TonB-dependent receptor [Idiomarina sp.]|tara:strand:- start:10 stop:2142 length:2133 start_codon:yes stop_codon:yes gene_type:complete